MEENYIRVHKFWERIKRTSLFNEICNINDLYPLEIYGLSQYIDEDNIYYYIASVNKCSTSKDIFEVIIPKSRWVVFECDNYEIDKVRDV